MHQVTIIGSENPRRFGLVIVGTGVSGTAECSIACEYTNIPSVLILDKETQIATVNSRTNGSSQTVHDGRIESNYDVFRAEKMKLVSDLIRRYVANLGYPVELMRRHSKMLLAVGAEEVAQLENRIREFRELFPEIIRMEAEDIARVEPKVMEGRNPKQPVLASYIPEDMTIDYGALSHSFINRSIEKHGERVKLMLGTRVEKLERLENGYRVHTNKGVFTTDAVLASAGGHSFNMARDLGYAQDLSILSIAGYFYETAQHLLEGKVYTMQDLKLPFAAVHGDPDFHSGNTRLGPTAAFYPTLERGRLEEFLPYMMKSFRLSGMATAIKVGILDPHVLRYIVRQWVYTNIPLIGKQLFVRNEARKIIPSISTSDVRLNRSLGGNRPQVIQNITNEKGPRGLYTGQAKIFGTNGDPIIFNVTPSPGATNCLANAVTDIKWLIRNVFTNVTFDEEAFRRDFGVSSNTIAALLS